VMGTPQYMSPEQCEGRSSIDHRTDIYALGILLYQMLTGRVPFVGANLGEVLVQQMAIPPLAPSLIVPQISLHLEQVVLKALEKRPEHRYSRMEDMILALRDPVQYVEAQGPGFLISSVLRDPALASPGAAMAMLGTAAGQRASTTLGGAAAQAVVPQAKPRLGRAIKLGLAGGVAAVIAVVVAMGARQAPPAPSPGDSVTQSPAAALPGQAAPSAAPQAAQAPATPSSPAAVAPQAPSAAPQAAPSALAAAAGATPATPPAAPSGASGQSAAPSGGPTQPPAVSPAKAVSITIASTPPGARVFVGGEPTPRGTTPLVLEGTRDAAPLEIRLALPGYRPHKRLIELDHDREINIVLDKPSGSTSAVGKPANSPPTAAKPAAAAPAAAKPADTAPGVVRPAGHDDQDDPMDPFAKKPPASQKAGGQEKEGP